LFGQEKGTCRSPTGLEAHNAAVEADPFGNRPWRLPGVNGGKTLTREERQAYSFQMTPRFKRIVEAAAWFVAGFVVHMLLLHFHHHPG